MSHLQNGQYINLDLYNVLEIDITADANTVKKAYKKLAIKYHPDRPGGNANKFKEISFAYEILSDLNKRKNYDRLRKFQNGRHETNNNNLHQSNQQQSHEFHFYDVSFDPFSIFSDVFGTFFDFVKNNNNPLTGTIFHNFPDITHFKLDNTNFLEDLDMLEEFVLANNFENGEALQFPESINTRNLGPIFKTAKETVDMIHNNFNIHTNSNNNTNTNTNNTNNNTEEVKLIEPNHLKQVLYVNLLDIYENKTRKFKLSRVRESKTEKSTLEIPLIYKQLRLSGEGDYYTNWQKAGDLVIDFYVDKTIDYKGYKRVNQFDLFKHLKVGFEKFFVENGKNYNENKNNSDDMNKVYFQLINSKIAKLLIEPEKLVEKDYFIVIRGFGLPKDHNYPENRGDLYLQILPVPILVENDLGGNIHNADSNEISEELVPDWTNSNTILDLEYDEE